MYLFPYSYQGLRDTRTLEDRKLSDNKVRFSICYGNELRKARKYPPRERVSDKKEKGYSSGGSIVRSRGKGGVLWVQSSH